MKIECEDVLNVGLVFPSIQLLNKSDSINAFEGSVGTDVTDALSPSGVAGVISINISTSVGEATPLSQPAIPSVPPFQRLRVDRDRIVLDIVPDRTSITKEYPSRDEIGRFAEVVGIAFENTDFSEQPIRAYGVNIEAVYRIATGEPASQFIVSRLFTPNIFHDEGYEVGAEQFQLRLRRDERAWRVRFRPRSNAQPDKLQVGLNLHNINDLGLIPSSEAIAALCTQVWGQMDSIMELFK